MTLDFKAQMDVDIGKVFLNTTEFAITAIYKSSVETKEIIIQFFEEPLDRLESKYFHAWCANNTIPLIQNGDTLTVDGIEYGIVDFNPDEFQNGLNIFLQKV